jgi:hypothetical protein
MKKTMALLAGAALMMLTSSAWAIPITGTISFTGSERLTPDSSTAVTATGMDFSNGEVHGGRTGIYAGIPTDTPVSFTDFSFAPSLAVGGINPLWILTYLDNTYSFDLESITTELQRDKFLVLSGKGILHATGFDATPGSWFFSTQDQGSTFSSESTAPAPVPEPGTMMLLSAGVFGLAVYAKRRKNEDGACNA